MRDLRAPEAASPPATCPEALLSVEELKARAMAGVEAALGRPMGDHVAPQREPSAPAKDGGDLSERAMRQRDPAPKAQMSIEEFWDRAMRPAEPGKSGGLRTQTLPARPVFPHGPDDDPALQHPCVPRPNPRAGELVCDPEVQLSGCGIGFRSNCVKIPILDLSRWLVVFE